MRQCAEPQVMKASQSVESMQSSQSLPGAANTQHKARKGKEINLYILRCVKKRRS